MHGIRNAAYPQYTVRIVEPKPGAALIAYWWEPGRGQRASGLGRRTRAMLGNTPTTQKDRAIELGRELIVGLATRGTVTASAPRGPLTLGVLYADYEKHGLLSVTRDYRRDALSCLSRVRDRFGAEFVVSDLTPSHVEKYIADRRATGKLVAGRRDMVALNIACGWAVKNKKRTGLVENPFDESGMKELLYLKHTPSRPFCTPEEFAALVAVAPRVVETMVWKRDTRTGKPRNRPASAQESTSAFPTLLQLAWHTGHRISAILSLTWDAVDFKVRPDAPFGAITWYKGALTDTKKHEHIMEMNERTQRLLLAWRESCRARDVQSFQRWVFPFGPNATRPLDYSDVRLWLRDAILLAKMPTKRFAGWHMFRRGWATRRAAEGMPLRDLAAVGGWRDTETLMKSYVHASTEGRLKVALFSA